MKQQFQKGDHVKVADDLGPSMSHFTAGVEALVVGSYRDQYGGGDDATNSYTLHLKGSGQCSWYYGQQLTLIEAGRLDLLAAWEAEKDAEVKLKSNRGWIFDNGPDVLEHPHCASIEALGKDIGCDNLWGSRGEGITYYSNATQILHLAAPFLAAKDKAGWMAFCTRGAHSANEGRS